MQLDQYAPSTARRYATMTVTRDADLSTPPVNDGHLPCTGPAPRRRHWVEGTDARGALAARLAT